MHHTYTVALLCNYSARRRMPPQTMPGSAQTPAISCPAFGVRLSRSDFISRSHACRL